MSQYTHLPASQYPDYRIIDFGNRTLCELDDYGTLELMPLFKQPLYLQIGESTLSILRVILEEPVETSSRAWGNNKNNAYEIFNLSYPADKILVRPDESPSGLLQSGDKIIALTSQNSIELSSFATPELCLDEASTNIRPSLRIGSLQQNFHLSPGKKDIDTHTMQVHIAECDIRTITNPRKSFVRSGNSSDGTLDIRALVDKLGHWMADDGSPQSYTGLVL